MSSGLTIPKGKIIGSFEIIERVGSIMSISGRPYGTYSVRCLKCGNNIVLTTHQIHQRKDCGCTKLSNIKRAIANRNPIIANKYTTWMSEGEIYRAWKDSKDKRQAFKILAQLNDVPIQSIIDIVQNEQEKSSKNA